MTKEKMTGKRITTPVIWAVSFALYWAIGASLAAAIPQGLWLWPLLAAAWVATAHLAIRAIARH